MRKYILTLLFFPSFIYAQVTYKIDTNSILIGDQIELTIEAELNSKDKWPVFKDSIGELELVSSSKIDSVSTEAGWILKQTFNITQWDSGFYRIPSIFIGDTKTEEFIITVNTINLEKDPQLKDIKQPISAPISFKEVIPYLLAIILIGIFIYFLLRYLKRKKPIQKVEKIIKQKDPFEIALNKLEILKTCRKWQNKDVKGYYSDLSEIIRTYIEDGLNTPAMEMLTTDIIRELEYKEIETQNLNVLLNMADMAKFAKSKPNSEKNELAMKYSIEFIHQTKPQNNE